MRTFGLFLFLAAVGVAFWEIARMVRQARAARARDFTGEFFDGDAP